MVHTLGPSRIMHIQMKRCPLLDPEIQNITTKLVAATEMISSSTERSDIIWDVGGHDVDKL